MGVGTLSGAHTALQDASVVLWALTIAWLPLLLAAELRWPRLHYDVRRWSTVFPVGMYAACSFVVGSAAHAHGIGDFARAWVWVGVAVWLIVFAAMIRRGLQLARGEPTSIHPTHSKPLPPSGHAIDAPPSNGRPSLT